MSGFAPGNRYTFKMAISEQEILRMLMKSRDRIAAAAWVVVRDAHAAEDIFQDVALKALTREVSFDAEGALLSWAFITARRRGIDWLRSWTRKDHHTFMADIAEQKVFVVDNEVEALAAVGQTLGNLGVEVTCFIRPVQCIERLCSQKCPKTGQPVVYKAVSIRNPARLFVFLDEHEQTVDEACFTVALR